MLNDKDGTFNLECFSIALSALQHFASNVTLRKVLKISINCTSYQEVFGFVVNRLYLGDIESPKY